MPLYAYTCTACGHSFDIQQSFSDDALTVCPECAGRLRKVFSPVGVVFKGSGFYRTDNKKSTSKALTKTPSKSDSSGTLTTTRDSGTSAASPAASPAKPSTTSAAPSASPTPAA